MKLISCLYAGLVVCILFGCKKKEDSPAPSDNPQAPILGTVGLHLHFYVGDDEVTSQMSDSAVNQTGRKIGFGFGKLYLSDIEFIKSDGSVEKLSGVAVLKANNYPTYEVGNIPIGIYKSVRFKVGLNTNLDTNYSAGILNDADMKFGAKSEGHIFWNIQGKIDTSANGDGTNREMIPFSYKIGTPAHLMPVLNIPQSKFTVSEIGVEYFHLIIDLSKLFTGIQLNKLENLSIKTKEDNSSEIAEKIAANIPSTFRLEIE